MSGPHMDDDGDLDALLGQLGPPDGATPLTSAAEIRARAVVLVPPVAAGLAGWKLAATLLFTLSAGLSGGWWLGQRGPTGTAESAPLTHAAPTAPVSPTPLATATAAPRPADPIDAVAPHLAEPTRLARADSPAPPPAQACASTEEPASELDFDALAALRPPEPTEAPAPEPDPAEALIVDALAAEDSAEAPNRSAGARGALGLRVGVGGLMVPEAGSGLRAELALLRAPAATDTRGWELGGGLGAGLFDGQLGAAWGLDLGAEASRLHRWRRVELGVGWTAAARLMLPGRHDPARSSPDGASPAEPDGLGWFPLTGPRLGLAFGDPSDQRLNLAFTAQLSPDAAREGVQPWFGLSLSTTLPTRRDEG